MEDGLVKYETAKLAKEKGFDEVTDIIYIFNYNRQIENINNLRYSDGKNPILLLPTQSLLQKWLREKHKLHISIFVACYSLNGEILFNYKIHFNNKVHVVGFNNSINYEEILETALIEALEII